MRGLRTFLIVTAAILFTAAVSAAQTAPDFPRSPDRITNSDPVDTRVIQEALEKKKRDAAEKDHQEMLERGEQALKLSEELEASFSRGSALNDRDRQKLGDLEKLLFKIRKTMGGDDDKEKSDEQPSDVVGAFKFLQNNVVKLVDELNKTSRFTISAAAIQTSNSLIRVVRFLRLKR